MSSARERLMELIFGRWRSQTLYAGVELGIFDVVSETPAPASEITDALDIDAELGYRLLRALGSLDVLAEGPGRTFSLTPTGKLLRSDHPKSLRGVTRLEEGPTHYALWPHLPELAREGEQNAFVREFGHPSFEHAETDPEYEAVFNDAMSSYSGMQTALVQEMLASSDFADDSRLCDVGGGYGHLLSTLLSENPHLEGTVLERPNVVEQEDHLWAPKMGVGDRCSYVAGDMFEAVPSADAYLLKYILHDWSDDECTQILSTIHANAPEGARVYIIEHIVPGPATSHFAKLFDIHMMVWGSGRERTRDEYADLLAESGWEYVDTRYPKNDLIGTVEATKA